MNDFNTDEPVLILELKRILNIHKVKKTEMVTTEFGGNKIYTFIVNVTPSLAENLLTRNYNNRPLSNSVVTRYVDSMKNDEWVYDGTALVFDRSGNLINGQHRLSAVYKSGKTLPFKIEVGYKSDVFTTMDIGKMRNGGDALAIAGIDNYRLAATTANFVFNVIKGTISTNSKKSLTHKQLVSFVTTNEQISESIKFFLENKKKLKRGSKIIAPSYIISGFHFLFSQKDKSKSDDFIFKLITGSDIGLENPIYVLREHLNYLNEKNERTKHSDIAKLFIVTWNKYKKGEKLRNLKIPEIMPIIS